MSPRKRRHKAHAACTNVREVTKDISSATISKTNFHAMMGPMLAHRKTRKDKPPVLLLQVSLCLPAACRRTTALGCPSLADLTCLVWPRLPQVFPRPQHGLLCLSIASSGCSSCVSAHATCYPYAFPPLHPRSPISVYHHLRVAKPDEPFEPCPLAALRFAAAVIAPRPSLQYDSRPESHGLRGLV